MQKRELYREQPINIPTNLTLIGTGETMAATAIDLSGSGIRIVLNHLLLIFPKVKVRVKFQLSDLGFNHEFNLVGTIIRSGECRFQGSSRTWLAIQFDLDSLEQAIQEEIIRYIFRRQLQWLKQRSQRRADRILHVA